MTRERFSTSRSSRSNALGERWISPDGPCRRLRFPSKVKSPNVALMKRVRAAHGIPMVFTRLLRPEGSYYAARRGAVMTAIFERARRSRVGTTISMAATIWLLTGAAPRAQSFGASVGGVITDATGAVLPGA